MTLSERSHLIGVIPGWMCGRRVTGPVDAHLRWAVNRADRASPLAAGFSLPGVQIRDPRVAGIRALGRAYALTEGIT